MEINHQILTGHWKEGYALDLHTSSSFPMKDPEGNNITDSNGNIRWDTKRPPIAEELYQLKYKYDKTHINTIAIEVANFIKAKANWNLHKIIPIPPSDTTRSFQPVYELAKAVGILCNLEVDFSLLKKLKSTSQLKTIKEIDQRKDILKDAFGITDSILVGKNILLFDDLFRSGETLNAAYDIIMNKGKAKNVYVLTITKTRTKR